MVKPKISVVFNQGAPLGGFEAISNRIEVGDGTLLFLNCHEVALSNSTGFLRIVPVVPDDWPTKLALYVHPHYVAWMLEADVPPRQLGFT